MAKGSRKRRGGAKRKKEAAYGRFARKDQPTFEPSAAHSPRPTISATAIVPTFDRAAEPPKPELALVKAAVAALPAPAAEARPSLIFAANRAVEASLLYLSESATTPEETTGDGEIFAPPPLPEDAAELTGPPAPPADTGSFVLLGQVCLAISLALLSEDFRVLLPLGMHGSGMLSTGLFLAAAAMLFRPLTELVEDVRRQKPGVGERLQNVAGLMTVGGGLAVALVGFAGNAAAPPVTAENLKQTVLDWSDRSGFNAQPEPANAAHYFAYKLNLPSGYPVTIQRTKVRADALNVVGSLRLSGSHQSAFAGLSGGQQQGFRQELEADMGEGVEVRFELPNAVYVEQLIPLGELSRATFHQAVLDADAALERVKTAVQRRAGG